MAAASKRSRRDFEADLQRQESPFVVYGTPLPPLDDHARDDGSYVPVWKQEVTDERGRKRLHGAFTGGFSAGYYNTVGSKEGWTPTAFVSSRKNRTTNAQQHKQQRPEDFMDEEDLREQEESRQLITDGEFAGFGTVSDPNHRDALADLVRPVEDSMGIKLLQRMGWRQGQGIGPKQRRTVDVQGNSEEVRSKAPPDLPMISFNKKTDYKGLGFDGENSMRGLSIETANQSSKSNDQPELEVDARKKTKHVKKTGFGVGILNDTGSDDEDPYAMGPRISYNKTIGAERKSKKQRDSNLGKANPLLKTAPVFVSKKGIQSLSALRKCHDGRMPLPGFVLADELDNFSTISLNDDKFKPERVPEDWVPSSLARTESPDHSPPKFISTSDAAKASTYNAKTRAQVLGETPLPGKSVFDFLSPAARDRLASASGRSDLPPARDEAAANINASSSFTDPTSKSVKQLSHLVPDLDPSTAQAALQRGTTGFMPYSDDLDKRARYKAFLEIMSRRLPSELTTKELIPSSEQPPRAPGHSDSDWSNELSEFARAAMVFKPIGGMMASRFTSASTDVMNTTPDDADTKDLLTRPLAKPPDPAVEAAKMGMFGPATRSVSSFYPSRLLCKRFAISMPDHASLPPPPPPTLSSIIPGLPAQTVPQSANKAEEAVLGSHRFQSAGVEADPSTTRKPTNADEGQGATSSEPVPVDPDRNEALEQERPGAAVFRAIFGNSDSESD